MDSEDSRAETGEINRNAAEVTLHDLCRHLTEDSQLPTAAVEGSSHIVRYANPAFCRLAGMESSALIGRPFTEAIPEGEENGCVRLLDRVFESGGAQNLSEQEHNHRGSTPIYWSYAVWAILDAARRPSGIMLQVTDATETVLFHRQSIAMNEQLLLSGVRQHELADFAQSLASRLQISEKETHHRVKNNLQVLAALVELQVDNESLTVPAAAMVRIGLHVRTLASLHDLLTQRSNTSPGEETLSARIALERLISLLEPAIGRRKIECRIAPLMLPLGQIASLSLLVSELISNAVKHGAGGITVMLQYVAGSARLSVSDEGAGFPLGFDPRTSANTGIELIIAMAYHDLRGEVAFTNRPEGGGHVVITFPIAGES